MRKKGNIYEHSIDLKNISIKNASRDNFIEKLEKIPYRGYTVENISDGRKIVITKPGGKNIFGAIKIEDYMVWIYNPVKKTLWRISHKDIYKDLEDKGRNNPEDTVKIICGLERVYKGEEPENVLKENEYNYTCGEKPEVLFKAYKWIWGQEDINYPKGFGRRMSYEGLTKKNNETIKTGEGILDLKNKFKKVKL
ncbi:MAG: hypothetical protein AUJ85_01775 [Elusimicrobia bacterium CG1_02_37_114]|nr:MAG: hypothetical protein AUJ85_01775 [Elusimicrobia bacterium CG1_02_37_114]PIV52589.1 MAG: hypothetical protein COS17_08335 [Elusimicrobia bacterium CG02_land_8_20_14_3_00_37_13]PIZ12838.1 MAG: hypothetical protein COY53_07910 [Elusimicrobia bacterium CG_4_10_14_0_8_um_filter_37_32]